MHAGVSAPHIRMNELAGQSLGGYQLEEEIGHGSMGMVYRGKQIALEREVAVKVLPHALARDASYVARFIREAQIIAGLNHPNIVQIYDAGQQNRLLYFVMEFVQGPTLASLLHLDGMIPQHLAAEYAAQIADALDAAYKERHVIHRDIKPENLMLDRWGKVKVMDFGLARAPGHQAITIAKTLVGSIYYASPEQVWGQILDNRSDLYALGVVLYEMVSGHRPFTGHSMPELTQAIIRGTLQPPTIYNPEIAPELERIILTALARDRDQRYAEASLMARDLRALNLKPPVLPQSPAVSMSGTYSSEQSHQAVHERVVVQPPKRPQMPRPSYPDITAEKTQPLSGEPPAGRARQQASTQTIQKAQRSHEQRSTDGATEPVEAISHPPVSSRPGSAPRREQSTTALLPVQKAQARRTLWSQLQRLFKPPAR
jgi:serine/threonine protein kinase